MKQARLLMLLSACLITLAAAAQNDWGWDWKDSSKVPVKRAPQYTEFLNNQFPYPPKPRNQIEIGAGVGYVAIYGDVSQRPGFGGTISVRKAIDHFWSVRASYNGFMAYGQDWKLRVPNVVTPAPGPWAAYGAGGYLPNFRNQTHMASVDMIYSINPASYYRGNPKFNIYVLAGYGIVGSDVDVDARQGDAQTGTTYAPGYAGINFFGKKSDIKKAARSIQDGQYETNAPVANNGRDPITRLNRNWLVRHAMTFGGGIAYKLSNKINVGLEQKFVNAFNDDMDGLYEGNSNDIVALSTVRINYNFGSPDKAVEPLWWINPNNYLYNELNNPRHMKQPKILLPDGDNDGVTDQFDLEPNTPAGAAVDAHGRAKDTDGDGVPDYKDKEILTQLSCFPVDKDGVGKCPEPACCKEIKDMMANWKPTSGGVVTGSGGMDGAITECAIGDLPSIVFKKGAQLSREAQSALAAAAAKIKANPSCKVKLIGYGTSSKNAQQLSWERVNAVKKYLIEQQGISETRIIFSYGQDGDANTVDIQATTEEGPMNLPAPHPNLKGRG